MTTRKRQSKSTAGESVTVTVVEPHLVYHDGEQRSGTLKDVPADLAEYWERHAAVWPEVLATIRACNMRNYSIFRWDDVLFAYFEYVGDDYAADMAKMAADPKTRAENMMIVDLVRNDLSRVATIGSVTVPELLVIRPAPGVWHLVSTVSARVPTATPMTALLDAAFPPEMAPAGLGRLSTCWRC